jgi:hypothetical protein
MSISRVQMGLRYDDVAFIRGNGGGATGRRPGSTDVDEQSSPGQRWRWRDSRGDNDGRKAPYEVPGRREQMYVSVEGGGLHCAMERSNESVDRRANNRVSSRLKTEIDDEGAKKATYLVDS